MKYFTCFLGAFLLFSNQVILAQNEMIVDDVTVTTSGGVIILNNTKLTNSGIIRDSAALWYISGTGDTAQSAIGGDSLTVINDIQINKSNTSPVVPLQGNFNILGSITLTDGLLYLDSNHIELGPDGYIVAEDNDNRIFDLGDGTIYKDTSLNAPSAANPGKMGAVLTSSSNIGAIRVTRGHNRQYRWDSLGYSIMRWYDFEPANNGSLNASLRFYYLGIEKSPFFNSELDMWMKYDTLWNPENVPYNASSRDYSSDSGWLQTTGIDSLVRVTLGSNQRLYLPVSWLNVTAQWKNAPSSSELHWSTGSELDAKHFEIERSYNGANFEKIGVVGAAGNSNETRNYIFTDNDVATSMFKDIVYYRLRQVDFNGEFSHSEVFPLSYNVDRIGFLVYPNPARNLVNLKVFGSKEQFDVHVVNAVGQHVSQIAMNGMDNATLDFSSYQQGTYFIRFIDKIGKTIKVISVQKID